jgi:hypothetical protein
MAAYITTKTVEIYRVVGYVDTLGYLYCTHCKHAGLNRASITDRVLSPDGACDACHTAMDQSVEIVLGLTTVEAIPCKIF